MSDFSGGMERQLDFYRQGMSGITPDFPVRYRELERKARRLMSETAYDYVAGGAGVEDTMRANREAFRRWRIVPRVLRDVSRRDLTVELPGGPFESPLMLAPLGVQRIIHPSGELATARAAAALGVPLALSTVSSTPLEEVARAMGDVPRWFQLYWPSDPELAGSLIDRAEAAGYGALVITLDAAFLGWRPRDLERAYLPFLHAEGLANYFGDPVFRASLDLPPEDDVRAAVQRVAALFANPALTWEDLDFARERTTLPIYLKGILDPEDARRALGHGMDGVIVSNHGGRQVDGAIGSLDALPDVVAAVDGRVPVLFDSGIRHGADVFKALALGARACMIGRPFALGLGVAGEAGVRDALLNLLAEFDLTMALSGCAALGEIDGRRLRGA